MSAGTWPERQPVLTGAAVRLRPWRESDAGSVYEACQDRAIQRWTTVPVPYRPEHARTYVEEIAPHAWAAREAALFAAEPAAGGELLASAGIVRVNLAAAVAEVGYWVVPTARGRGVASEATALVTAWAFDELGFARVELLAEPGNAASCRVAERLGFVREGVLRGKGELRGRRVDLALYALLRDDPRRF